MSQRKNAGESSWHAFDFATEERMPALLHDPAHGGQHGDARVHNLRPQCAARISRDGRLAAYGRPGLRRNRASASRMRLTSEAVVKQKPAGSQKPSGADTPGSVRASAARARASSSGLRNGSAAAG